MGISGFTVNQGKGTTFKMYLPRVDELKEELGKRKDIAEVFRRKEAALVVEHRKSCPEVSGEDIGQAYKKC